MTQEETDRTLFLTRLLADQERSAVAPIEDYERAFPRIAAFVRSEYATLTGGAEATGNDRYQVEHLLAVGGMGDVHVALDRVLGRRVVLKCVRTGFATERAVERLQREARMLSRLDHPHICRILDVFARGEEWLLVLPLLQGGTLAERLDAARARTPRPTCVDLVDGAPSLPALVDWFAKVALAIDAAHAHGVVHRDLKPSNLFVQSDGAPVVLDFGLAQAADGDDQHLTRTGEQLGTPLYMAPEQVEGLPCDPRTDVYALGVVLYEALTLCRPFEGATRQATFRQIMEREPKPVRTRNPTVPRDLEAVCHKAMAREPSLRYATARAFADDLHRVVTLQPTVARPPSGVATLVRAVRRRRAGIAVGALLVTLIASLAWPKVEAALRRRARVLSTIDGHGVLLLIKDSATAYQFIRRSLEEEPTDPLGMLKRIALSDQMYKVANRPREALRILDRAIETLESPGFASAWSAADQQSICATQQIMLRDRPEAGSHADVLGWAYGRRGWIRVRVGDFDGALADLDLAIKMLARTDNHHRRTNAIHMRGEARSRMGRTATETEAEADLALATALYHEPRFGGDSGPPPKPDANGPFAIEVVRGHAVLRAGNFARAALAYDQFLQNWVDYSHGWDRREYRSAGWPTSYLGWIDGGNNHDPAHACLWLTEALVWEDGPLAQNARARRSLALVTVNYDNDAFVNLAFHRRYLQLVDCWRSVTAVIPMLEQIADLDQDWELLGNGRYCEFFDCAWFESRVLQAALPHAVVIDLDRTKASDGPSTRFEARVRADGDVHRKVLDAPPNAAAILELIGDHRPFYLIPGQHLPADVLRDLERAGARIRVAVAQCVANP